MACGGTSRREHWGQKPDSSSWNAEQLAQGYGRSMRGNSGPSSVSAAGTSPSRIGFTAAIRRPAAAMTGSKTTLPPSNRAPSRDGRRAAPRVSRLGLPRLPARTCASGIGLTDSTFWEPDISARVGVTELPSRRPSLTPALRRTRRTFFFDPRMHTQLPRLTASRTTGRPFTGSGPRASTGGPDPEGGGPAGERCRLVFSSPPQCKYSISSSPVYVGRPRRGNAEPAGGAAGDSYSEAGGLGQPGRVYYGSGTFSDQTRTARAREAGAIPRETEHE